MLFLKPYQWLAVGAITISFGCGVRQYNADPNSGRTPDSAQPSGPLFKSYAPHYASGQKGELIAVANPATGCRSNTGRPCVRARASVGLPYQFDQNSVADRHPDNGGAGGAGSFTTTAGPGKTSVAAGPRAPDLPRMENRDLHVIKGQTAPGEQTF